MENKLYYAGLRLEKDKEMCKIYDQIEADNNAIILRHGRNTTVIECEYKNNYSNEITPTGKTHLGFEFSYITVFYDGLIWGIEPATYYPFTDENNPGSINAVPYMLVDGYKKVQCGYSQAFTSLESLQKPLRLTPLKDVYANPITYYYNDFLRIYGKQAGNREKEIFNAPHVCFEVQNTPDHKVIRCAKTEREADGVRLYFDIDIINGKITG